MPHARKAAGGAAAARFARRRARRRRSPIMPARRRFWSAIRRFLHTDPFPSAAHRAGRTMTQTAVGL
ncbi:hypothetical protein BURMUCGD1_2784 [Burkholderia multivorans CGD1]|nr:hypothetical protein BURMUCGD1_2784 [Burkholderia multivorans CGD1]